MKTLFGKEQNLLRGILLFAFMSFSLVSYSESKLDSTDKRNFYGSPSKIQHPHRFRYDLELYAPWLRENNFSPYIEQPISASQDASYDSGSGIRRGFDPLSDQEILVGPGLYAGVLQNLNQEFLESLGWKLCHKDTYADSFNLNSVLDSCGVFLAIGCKPVRGNKISVLAMGLKEEILLPTDFQNPLDHNQVIFENIPNRGFGFSAQKNSVFDSDESCSNTGGSKSMCWNMAGSNVLQGHSCGEETGIYKDNQWERLIYTKTVSQSESEK